MTMYNLEMWDTGERYLHKFDYILPACVKNCDVILFFFSITDRYDYFNTLFGQISQAHTTYNDSKILCSCDLLVVRHLHALPTLFLYPKVFSHH